MDYKCRRGFTLIELVVAIVVLFVNIASCRPFLNHDRTSPD